MVSYVAAWKSQPVESTTGARSGFHYIVTTQVNIHQLQGTLDMFHHSYISCFVKNIFTSLVSVRFMVCTLHVVTIEYFLEGLKTRDTSQIVFS